MDIKSPIHETALVAELLAMASGGIDSYSYLTHNHVFSGTQTGNLVLLGINIAQGHFSLIMNYLLPIVVYVIATALTKYTALNFTHYHNISRQSFVLLIEVFLLFFVGLIGDKIPLSLTSLVMSLCIAVLFTEFNKVSDMPLNAVMMTGNFNKVGRFLTEGLLSKNRTLIYKGLKVFAIILAFFSGAIIDAFFIKYFSFKTIFFNAIILVIILLIITYGNYKVLKEFNNRDLN